MPTRLFWMMGLLWMLGCGGDGGGDEPAAPPVTLGNDGGTGRIVCVDDDGDGFGLHCNGGADCDDEDPDVTDECRRCVANPGRKANIKGCPCDAGTPPMSGCDPPDVAAVMDGVQGKVVCSEGTWYCREEKWSACEILLQYATFVPN